jgi:hypothetical protein
MKNAIYILAALTLSLGANAQFTMDFESGSRGVEQANCWQFGAISYRTNRPEVISGNTSASTNQLTNPSLSACWMKTPWLTWSSGNVTFQTGWRDNGNGSTRGIRVRFIPFDDNAAYDEGTYSAVEYSFDYVKNGSNWPDEFISFPVPAQYQNGQPYRMMISYVGTGGRARIITDDMSFHF